MTCKEWNTSGHMAPLTDFLMKATSMASGSIGFTPMKQTTGRSRTVHFPRSCLHCEEPACVTVCPTGAFTSEHRTASCWSTRTNASAANFAAGRVPMARASSTATTASMKKCTLCVDRIYNENLPEEDRVPACVAACPTSARHFGDLGDPSSGVASGRGAGRLRLMPELGYKPTNRYLPPRARKDGLSCGSQEQISLVDLAAKEAAPKGKGAVLLRWADRVLSR